MTITKAASELDKLGYTLGRGRTDLAAKVTFYAVTDAAGNVTEMNTKQIAAIAKEQVK